jgi:uncharacterized membrane protein
VAREDEALIMLKTITWRILIIITMLIINKLMKLETKKSVKIIAVTNIVNMVLYYIHEMIWR